MEHTALPGTPHVARIRPGWSVFALACAVYVARAWYVQASVPADTMSSLGTYLGDAVTFGLFQGLWMAAVTAIFSILPPWIGTTRLERATFAVAAWMTLLALLPPREGNFWANGAADDGLLCYPPTALVGVLLAWLLVRAGWPGFCVRVALQAATAAALVQATGGAGAATFAQDASVVVGVGMVLAVVLAIATRFKRAV